jgi:hypothetical protein
VPRDRQAKKQAVRARREAEEKAARRRSTRTRIAFITTAALATFAISWFLLRAPGPGSIPASAARTAETAGCTAVETPASDAPGGEHLAEGATFAYDQDPPTSGPHDPTPLPDQPRVATEPLPQTKAVHTLEHAAAIVYYVPEGSDAPTPEVVDSLRGVVEGASFAYLAPYPDLPQGTGIALAAWNRLQTCPGSMDATDAATVAGAFVEAFACTSNAPEPRAGGC